MTFPPVLSARDGSGAGVVPTVSDEKIAATLSAIKRDARNRRIVAAAPVLLIAAIAGAFIASPPQHGGEFALVGEAQASDSRNLPRVFGVDGDWQLAEPISDDPAVDTGPAAVVEAPVGPSLPSYVLNPPDEQEAKSVPALASTPPTLTPEQTRDPSERTGAEVSLPVVTIQPPVVLSEESQEVAAAGPVEAESSSSTADAAVTASGDVLPAEAVPNQTRPAGDVSDLEAADTVTSSGVYPSTPPNESADAGSRDDVVVPVSDPATISPLAVIVHSDHVSVRVQVVDEDSNVLHRCATRVDWGDGTTSGMAGPGADDPCVDQCGEPAAIATTGVNVELMFEHTYAGALDASPRVYVATGDGCNFTLAELGLKTMAIVPYE